LLLEQLYFVFHVEPPHRRRLRANKNAHQSNIDIDDQTHALMMAVRRIPRMRLVTRTTSVLSSKSSFTGRPRCIW
jgi:hypothetical protein